jgi:hypothetical protein
MTLDLSSFQLPAFWRDASVAWCALPSSWVQRPSDHTELLLFEAISGVRAPAPSDIGASEALFHRNITIAGATMAWIEATVIDLCDDEGFDPVLRPVQQLLLEAFELPSALRLAALSFIDARLNRSGVEPDYLRLFVRERNAFAAEVAARWERDQSEGW